MKHAKVATALLDVGGLRFNTVDPFILASRKICPVYVDVRRLTTKPEGWRAAVDGLVKVVKGLGNINAVSGGELADLLFSVPVAFELGLPHLAIRKQPKGYGTGGRLIGEVNPGSSFAHVSDLITSGTSALQWIDAIREAGGVVNDYLVVFDRKQGGREALDRKGVRVHSLLELDNDFMSFALGQGSLTDAQMDAVQEYLADPERWSVGYLRRNPRFLTERITASGGRMSRSEGLEVLTQGYPELITEVGAKVRRRLREVGLDEDLLGQNHKPL
jgi:orotate phosphoribosyltransferase